jgi:predicted nucleic acid-binding protein
MYVIDVSSAVTACLAEGGFAALGQVALRAPDLLWSEATSVLHQMRWRRAISPELAGAALDRLRDAPIQPDRRRGLRDEAWRVADELGWAKTYDAEYVALARLRRCPLVTLDDRLKRGAGRLVEVLGPAQVHP